jgi:hypothetical protein
MSEVLFYYTALGDFLQLPLRQGEIGTRRKIDKEGCEP